jgi:arginine deiminase
MSKHETPMTRWYWQQVRGTLIEEFIAVEHSETRGRRLLDGVIVQGTEFRIARQSDVSIEGKDIIVIQTKASRLGMYLMGQTLFSAELMKRFNPRSIKSVALCSQDDEVLRPLLEQHLGMQVVICPKVTESKG